MIAEFLTNQIVVSAAVAAIICHVWKIIDKYGRNKRFDWAYLVEAGGMPSSHAPFACSLALSVCFVEGPLSSVFLLATGFAIVVVRDAFGVRRAVDRLNRTVNGIIKEKKLGVEQLLKITGHTPVQAMVGALLGIAVSVLFEIFVYA